MFNKSIEVIKNNYLVFGFVVALLLTLGTSYLFLEDVRLLWAVGGLSTYTTIFFGLHLRDAILEIKKPEWVVKMSLKDKESLIRENLKSRINHSRNVFFLSLGIFFIMYASSFFGAIYIISSVLSVLMCVVSFFIYVCFRIIKRDWERYLKYKEDALEDIMNKSGRLQQEIRIKDWLDVDVRDLD